MNADSDTPSDADPSGSDPSGSSPTPTPPPVPEDNPPAPPPTKKFGKSESDWAMFTHLSALVCVVSVPSFLGPLVLWLIKKDEMPSVDRAGKGALNFQLTMFLVQLASIPLAFFGVGFLTLLAAALLSIIFAIVAGVEANKGGEYRYPLTIPFIR